MQHKAVLRRTLKRAAKPMHDVAKSYAAYDQGDLEASVKITNKAPKGHDVGKNAYSKAKGRGASNSEAVAAMRTARRNDPNSAIAEAFIVAEDPAALWVEFGTGERVQKSTGRNVGKMEPDPFMRPAFDSKVHVSVSMIRDILKEEIQKTARRIAAKAAKAPKG